MDQLEKLEAKKKILTEERSDLLTQYNKLATKIEKNYSKLDKVNEEIDSFILDPDDIGPLLETFPETNIKRKLLEKFLKYYGLSSGGYYPHTGQTAIKICLYKNNDKIRDRTYEGLLQIIPHIKPLDCGSKVISIFEQTLSQYALYRLHIWDEKFTVQNDRRSYIKSDILFESADLMETLKYIQKNLYYGK